MLDHLILMLSLLGTGHVGVATIFGSSRWDRTNPHDRLACLHRRIDDANDFVIAHNVLPCGTRVWVVNQRTGLSTLAEVADRGPRHAYADLSRRVAAAIGHNGREDVLLVPLSIPPPKKKRGTVEPELFVRVPAPLEETWDVPEEARLLRVPLAPPVAALPGPPPTRLADSAPE